MAATFDACTIGDGSGASATINHTPVGTPSLAVILIQKGGADTIGSVTYGGQACTLVGATTSGNQQVSSYMLVSPPSGAQNAVISRTASDSFFITAGVITFTGASSATGHQGSIQFGAGSSVAQLTVSSATDDLVVDLAAVGVSPGADLALNPGGSQTERADFWDGDEDNAAVSTKPGAASVTMDYSWTLTGNEGVRNHVAVSIQATKSPWYYYANQQAVR